MQPNEEDLEIILILTKFPELALLHTIPRLKRAWVYLGNNV